MLAYPTEADGQRRFDDAICNKLLREFARHSEWADAPQTMRPRHAFLDPIVADRKFEAGIKVINEQRILAGKMASPTWAGYLQEQLGVTFPDLEIVGPTSIPAWTAAAIDLDRYRETDTEGDKSNIVRRCWTPSKPVLHLCIALHIVLHAEAPNLPGLNIGNFFDDGELIQKVMGWANYIFPSVPDLFKISADDLIEVVAT